MISFAVVWFLEHTATSSVCGIWLMALMCSEANPEPMMPIFNELFMIFH